MAFKFVVLAAFIAATNAGILQAPVATSYAAGPILGAPATFAAGPLVRSTPIAAPLLRSAPLTAAPFGFAPRFAAPLGLSAPITKVAAPLAVAKTVVADDYDPNPQYSFGYNVQDSLTGDNKNQVESRSGDVVQGSYSVVDPDGTRRTVEYTADPINGFNAVVHREPLVAAAPVVAKVAAPVVAGPTIAKFAAPIAKFGSPLAYSTSVLH